MRLRYLLLATIKTDYTDRRPDLAGLGNLIADVIRANTTIPLDVVTVIGHPLDDPNADGRQVNLFGAVTATYRKVDP